MTFLELSSSSRASQEDNFRDDCFTPGDRVDIVTEFHRKAEDNIPMVRLRAPAAVRADQHQDPGLGADECMNHGRMGTGIPAGGSLRYRKGVPQQLGDMQLPCCQTRESLSSGKCCIFCYRLFCHHDCRISTHSNYILIS